MNLSRRAFLSGASAAAVSAVVPLPVLREEGVMSGVAIAQMFFASQPRIRPMAGEYYPIFVRQWVMDDLLMAQEIPASEVFL